MDNPSTLGKLYKYKPLNNHIGLEGTIPIRNKDVYMGVELELENVSSPWEISTSKTIEDHSLKLNGLELVTIPIKMRYLEVELRRILGGVKSATISSRCSVHVHMNVRDMTVKQLINLVLLYMIFERSLYRVSGERWNSNFCVPLNMDHGLVRNFLKYEAYPGNWVWKKYSGLNLSPIWGGESSKLGTIEFRQHKGTTSVEEIIQWCNLITSLKRAAQTIPNDELLAHIRIMNTTSGYGWLVKEVFGPLRRLLTSQPTFARDVEWCIGNLKTIIPTDMLGYNNGKDKKKLKTANTFAEKSVSSLGDTPTFLSTEVEAWVNNVLLEPNTQPLATNPEPFYVSITQQDLIVSGLSVSQYAKKYYPGAIVSVAVDNTISESEF